MNWSALDLSILWPALVAGLLVTATHVPLGTQVLARGIVFIDLAIAQVAGCGVLLADRGGIDRFGLYVLFALAVTVAVHLVGVYLVFARLIVPPLATRRMSSGRLAAAWGLGVAGYVLGLLLSTALDLPTGPTIVWALVVLASVWYAISTGRTAQTVALASSGGRTARNITSNDKS